MKPIATKFLFASMLLWGTTALADDMEEIMLRAGQSTFVLTELQRYKISCEGSPTLTVLRSACFCSGSSYNTRMTQRTFLSNGQVRDDVLGGYSDMDVCDQKLQEYSATICKPYIAQTGFGR
jgi:hypothetical protein